MIDTTVTNAVDRVFARRRDEGRIVFIPYLTAGYPDRASSPGLAQTLAAHGADIIEVGVPFSDPIGDGPTIQHASTVALRQGMTVRGALDLAATITRGTGTPLVLMGYYNPIMRYGLDRFCVDAAAAGVSGVIVPDLPLQEADELQECCRAHDMHLIYLLAPTSTEERIRAVTARATGFIYCVAVTGVTGARSDLASDLPAFLARVRAHTALPLVVGFGISRPEHITRLHGLADGVVVASALIDLIDKTPAEQREAAAGSYIERMSAACSAS